MRPEPDGTRPDGSSLMIDGNSVHAEEFSAIVKHYRCAVCAAVYVPSLARACEARHTQEHP